MHAIDLPGWVTALGAAFLTLIGGLAVALVNRSPALAAIVDARVKLILEESEQRISDLKSELAAAEARAERLKDELSAAEARAGHLQDEVEHLRVELARQNRLF